MNKDMRSCYMWSTVKNVALLSLIGFAIHETGNLWSLVGLLFLFTCVKEGEDE